MAKYALLVGISEYQDPEITKVAFAARDARILGESLEKDCGFDDVRVLSSDSEETVGIAAISAELINLRSLMEEEDTFFFFFAGHGRCRDGKGVLLPADVRWGMSALSELPVAKLVTEINNLSASQRALVFDCCRNDPEASRGQGDNLLSDDFTRDIKAVAQSGSAGVSSTCLLYSCSLGERAHGWGEKEHGVYTYFFLEALKEKAWSGEELTIQDVAGYLEEAVPMHSSKNNRTQTPWVEWCGSMKPFVLGTRSEQSVGDGEGEAAIKRMPPDISQAEFFFGSQFGKKMSYLNMRINDLRGGDLQGANLRGSHFGGADLHGAKVEGADFRGATGVNLEGTIGSPAYRPKDSAIDILGPGGCLRGLYLEKEDLRNESLPGVDLSYACLKNTDLRGAGLWGANLEAADLRGAKLDGADLRGATGVDLEGTIGRPAYYPEDNFRDECPDKWHELWEAGPLEDPTFASLVEAGVLPEKWHELMGEPSLGWGKLLMGADLGHRWRCCPLSGEDLRGASLCGVDLSYKDLGDANLEGAKLEGADLEGANLDGARIDGADFRGARGVDLEGAIGTPAYIPEDGEMEEDEDSFDSALEDGDLSGWDLSGQDLSSINLSEADLSEADLEGADLSGANLEGTDLSGANLEGTDLRGAIGVDLAGTVGTPAHMPDDPQGE